MQNPALTTLSIKIYLCCLLHKFHILRHSPGVCSKVMLLGSHGFETFQQGTINRTQVLRAKLTVSGLRTRDIEKSEPSMLGMNSWMDKCRHALSFLKFQVGLEASSFVMLNARLQRAKFQSNLGKKSCLHTLINPDQHVPNSLIHGITTNMVNQPDVPRSQVMQHFLLISVYLKFEFIDYLYIDYLFTGDAPSWIIAVFARMKDFIPILMHYIRSRQQIPLSLSLFIAHNARCFDVPFLVKEFLAVVQWIFLLIGCFLDTLPLPRQLMKLNDATHRAMSDVDLLTAILERMTIDMKLTITDFVEKSFKASDLIDSKTKKKS